MDPKKHVCLTVFTSAEARYWLTVSVFRDIMCTNLQPSIWLMISRGSPQTSRPQRGTWFSAVKKQRRTSKYCGACKLAFPHQCKQVRQDNQPSKMTLQKLLPKQSSSTILELSACVGPGWATWVSSYIVNIPLARFKEKGLLPSLNLGVHRTLSSKPDSSLAV